MTAAPVSNSNNPSNHPANPWAMKLVPLDRIARDLGIQIRGGIDKDLVCQYAEIIEEQGHMDPVALFREGEILLLADGFHRLEAYLSLGAKLGTNKIPARIKDGSRTDALKYALRENGHHGAPLSGAQKRHAAGVAVLDPGIAIMPDKDIAQMIGCSVSLVNEVRRAGASKKNKQIKPDPTHKKIMASPGPEPKSSSGNGQAHASSSNSSLPVQFPSAGKFQDAIKTAIKQTAARCAEIADNVERCADIADDAPFSVSVAAALIRTEFGL